MEQQTIFALLFAGIVIVGLFVAFLLELNKKNNEIRRLRLLEVLMINKNITEAIDINCVKTEREISERLLFDQAGRQVLAKEISRELGNVAGAAGLIRYNVKRHPNPDRSLYIVEAELRMLPIDKKKDGHPIIQEPTNQHF